MDPYTRVALERGEAKRLSKSADRAVFSKKTPPGEVTEKENAVPYMKFVEFLEQVNQYNLFLGIKKYLKNQAFENL